MPPSMRNLVYIYVCVRLNSQLVQRVILLPTKHRPLLRQAAHECSRSRLSCFWHPHPMLELEKYDWLDGRKKERFEHVENIHVCGV
jgi:hypothetical protein